MADHEWVAESLVQFARSPLWTAPVQNFVDEKCGAFNNDAEMKLEYTAIHNDFRALIDRLLTCFLEELGVAPQQAVDALQKCAGADTTNNKLRTAASRLLKYIYSVDDFACFHRLMVKRNIELDIEAYTELQRKGVVSADATPTYASTPDEMPVDGAASEQRVRDANGELDEGEALRLAIEASLHDKVMAEKRLALEEAQLQEALAVNACAEQRQAQHSADSVPHDMQQIASRALYSQAPTRPPASATAVETRLEQPQQQHHAQHAVEHALSGHVPEVQRTITTQLAETPAQPREAATAPHDNATQPSTQQQREQASRATPPKHVAKPAAQLGLSALPPISAALPPPPHATRPTQGNAGHAAATVAKTTATTAATASGTQPSAPTAKPPTKEELDARARHMREQRERIIAQNKTTRQQTLQEYADNHNAELPKTAGGQEAAERKLTIDIARRLRDDILDEVRRQ